MILEAIVTTMNGDGAINVAPMGASVDEDFVARPTSFILRPYRTSRTYANLKAHPEGVLHVVDDVLLLARATVGNANPPLVNADLVRGKRLADCVRHYEFDIEKLDDREERTTIVARVVAAGRTRDFFGFCRAKHAAVEAAILASRVKILPRSLLLAELDRLRILVEKTAGRPEREAFDLLAAHIDQEASVES